MKFMGIDFGTKRVGVSLSDEGGKLAFPYVVLDNDKHLIKRLAEIIKTELVSGVVIGEPLNNQGKPNAIMGDINNFKDKLEAETGIKACFEREFFSSVEAEKIQGRVAKKDASAAAIILQRFLSTPASGRRC
jgi:putative Holliday junction resolvase